MGKPKRAGRQDVIKSSAAIQIQNKITLLQRRTWNALLYNAYNELETQEEHSIALQEVARLVGYESHDMEYLKEASRAMMSCIVEWDVLDKDGSPEWNATALLAQVKIKRGICTYAYSPELRRRLHNPAMYARLDLNLQKQFESKYSLALWELCTDYLGSGREYGETPFIPIEVFRKLMGVTDTMYPAFMNFNQKIIKPAVDEINRVSDFRVIVDFQRQGRKVTALKFKMRRVLSLPEAVTAQGKLFSEWDDLPTVVRELQEAGIAVHDAWDIWQRAWSVIVDERAQPAEPPEEADMAFVRYIREKIHLLRRRQAAGKVDNTTGFLLEAIRQNYANPEYEHELQRQAAVDAHQARQARDKQIQTLAAQKAALEKGRDQALDHLACHVATEAPEVLEQAASALLQDTFGLRQFYDRAKSALENYQASQAVQAFLHPALERYAPTRFAAVTQRYAPQIAAIEAQMTAVHAGESGSPLLP